MHDYEHQWGLPLLVLAPSVILFTKVIEIQHKIIEGDKVRLFGKARILTFLLALNRASAA